jgi:mono/diheme cytochrome c family protein
MRQPWLIAAVLAIGIAAMPAGAQAAAKAQLTLHPTRTHADDLEIGGDLIGVPTGQTRFVTYADLQQLPQVQFQLTHGTTFQGTVRVSGIFLDALEHAVRAKPGSSMVVAICTDQYNAHYTDAYVHAHRPVLVLSINGLDHTHWPEGAELETMGPYLIAQNAYQPRYKVLSHEEEEQEPWGVARLDLRHEADVYAPIEPIGPHATITSVHQGYIIARENCFRCHNRGNEGGTKAGLPWNVVAGIAVGDPTLFAAYVRNPSKINPASQMAPSPNYDDATIDALRAYFQPFANTP